MTSESALGSRDRQLGAFSHVDQTDSDEFINRLDEMRALESFRLYKKATYELLNLTAGSRAADIGCGTGEDARAMAAITGPEGRVTGVDLSEAMVSQARGRHTDVPGLDFACGPGEKLGFEDGSLDAIRADRVLIHVPDPEATIDEMVRVLKPGGRICISEPDMPGFWVASADPKTTDLVARAIAGSCATPYLPRDLYGMLRSRDLGDIRYEVRAMTSFDLAAASKILDFEAVLKLMVGKGMLHEKQAKVWLADLQTRAAQGRFVAQLAIMIASATKP